MCFTTEVVQSSFWKTGWEGSGQDRRCLSREIATGKVNFFKNPFLSLLYEISNPKLFILIMIMIYYDSANVFRTLKKNLSMCSALSLVDSFLVSFDWLITFRPKVTITAGKKRGKTPRPASPLPEVSVSVRQPGMLTLSLICRFIFGNFLIKCFRCYINHTSFSTIR